MSRKGRKLTEADFNRYRGYYWRPVSEQTTRCRVWAPSGRLLYQTARDDVERSIDQDIEHQARLAGLQTAKREMRSAAELLRQLRGDE